MRGVTLRTPNILKRAHEDRAAIFLAGHRVPAPSPSVASPNLVGLSYLLWNRYLLLIQVLPLDGAATLRFIGELTNNNVPVLGCELSKRLQLGADREVNVLALITHSGVQCHVRHRTLLLVLYRAERTESGDDVPQ